MSTIHITTAGHPLVRITVTGDAFTLESNLDESASAQALGDAIEELGESFGGDAAGKARDQAAVLRGRHAPSRDIAQALIEMIAETFEEVDPPLTNIDLKRWRAAGAN